MPFNYELTKETIQVLNGKVQKVAEDIGVSHQALYGILDGTKNDPFSLIEAICESVAKRGGNIWPYINKLEAIAQRHDQGDDSLCVRKLLTENLEATGRLNVELSRAAEDGKLDRFEANEIIPLARRVAKAGERAYKMALGVFL